MILTLNEVVDLKKRVDESFGVQIHFHDGCGGQYFSVDRPTEELKEFIIRFFDARNLNVLFSENWEQFSAEKRKE